MRTQPGGGVDAVQSFWGGELEGQRRTCQLVVIARFLCMYVCMYVYFNEWSSNRVLVRLGLDTLIGSV